MAGSPRSCPRNSPNLSSYAKPPPPQHQHLFNFKYDTRYFLSLLPQQSTTMATPPSLAEKIIPLSTPGRVYQDNFSPAQGNALQAAVASIFGMSLNEVPNFIEMEEGYEAAITRFYQQGLGHGHGCVIEGRECDKVMLNVNGSCDSSSEWSYMASDLRHLRSPEDQESINARRENMIDSMDSLVHHEKITTSQLDKIEQAVVKGKQEILDEIPKFPCKIPDEYNSKICILRGKSPRGDFGHVVVAKHIADGKFEMMHDPHPDATFLDTRDAYGWCLFFV